MSARCLINWTAQALAVWPLWPCQDSEFDLRLLPENQALVANCLRKGTQKSFPNFAGAVATPISWVASEEDPNGAGHGTVVWQQGFALCVVWFDHSQQRLRLTPMQSPHFGPQPLASSLSNAAAAQPKGSQSTCAKELGQHVGAAADPLAPLQHRHHQHWHLHLRFACLSHWHQRHHINYNYLDTPHYKIIWLVHPIG